MRRLIMYLFPFWFGRYRRCGACKRIWKKTEMFYDPAYGYYCSEAEMAEWWNANQM
jgi:hypothetical protein